MGCPVPVHCRHCNEPLDVYVPASERFCCQDAPRISRHQSRRDRARRGNRGAGAVTARKTVGTPLGRPLTRFSMDKIDQELRDKLQAVLDSGISEDAMKAVKKSTDTILYDIQGDLEYRLKDELTPNLVGWVVDMAQRAVEQLLDGNEDQMRRYLSCEKRGPDGSWYGWTGRSTGYTGPNRAIHEQHPVIHGKLFEQGCIALRKRIVDAHRDLLANERVLDLEDQVKSLVEQVNKAKAEKEALWQRVQNREFA